MQIKSLFHYLWKLPLCGLAYFVGFALGSQLAAWMGLAAPDIPAGADQATLFQLTVLGSLILALVLAWLSTAMSGGFVIRWLSLFFLAWIAHGVNNYLEAAIFSTMSAASPYTVVFYFAAFLLLGATVAWLFPPAVRGESFFAQIRTYFAGRTAGGWAWRLLAAFLAFPLIYYLVGSLIAPLVIDYYRQGVSELALPGWDQILPVLFLRSLLFLIACLPVLIAWQASSRRLFVALGLALFACVGGVAMLQAHWFPPTLRIVHSLEMFVDEMLYAGALVFLLGRSEARQDNAKLETRAQPLSEPVHDSK